MTVPANGRLSPAGRAVLGAVVATAVVIVAALTSGRTALPAPLWIALVLGAVLTLRLLDPSDRLERVDLALAAAIGVAASAAHLHPGVVLGHDTQHHIWGAFAWLQAWRAGDWLPVWLHHLGLGLPLPLFYGPLPFYAMAPIAAAGAGAAWMLNSSFLLAGVVSSVVAFRVVDIWTRDRRAALVAATAWAYAPYRLLDANYRSGLGETWALALFPLLLFAFARLLAQPGLRRFRLAAIATALLALAHPLSLVMAAVLLPLLWLSCLPPWRAGWRRSFDGAARSLGAGLTGLALVGFFTLPLFAESRFTSLEQTVGEPGKVRYFAHGLHLEQLVQRRLWSRTEWSVRAGEESAQQPDMPFYVGVLWLAALALAPAAARNRAGPHVPLRALGLVGLFALTLSLLPVARLESAFAPIAILQFPWRFLGPASAAAALGLGLLVARSATGPASRWLAAAAALVVLLDGFPYSGAVARALPWDGLARVNFSPVGTIHAKSVALPWPIRVEGDLLPPATTAAEVGNSWAYRDYLTPVVRKISDPVPLSIGFSSSGGAHGHQIDALPYARALRHGHLRPLPFARRAGRIEVETGGHAGALEVAEQYFPGWQVAVDGKWQEVVPSANGLLAARIRPGVKHLRFRFDRWRSDRLAGWVVSGVSCLGLLLAGTVTRRRQASAGRRPEGTVL